MVVDTLASGKSRPIGVPVVPSNENLFAREITWWENGISASSGDSRPSVPASTGGAIGERWVIVHHNGFWTFLANVPGVNFAGVERM